MPLGHPSKWHGLYRLSVTGGTSLHQVNCIIDCLVTAAAPVAEQPDVPATTDSSGESQKWFLHQTIHWQVHPVTCAPSVGLLPGSAGPPIWTPASGSRSRPSWAASPAEVTGGSWSMVSRPGGVQEQCPRQPETLKNCCGLGRSRPGDLQGLSRPGGQDTGLWGLPSV